MIEQESRSPRIVSLCGWNNTSSKKVLIFYHLLCRDDLLAGSGHGLLDLSGNKLDVARAGHIGCTGMNNKTNHKYPYH